MLPGQLNIPHFYNKDLSKICLNTSLLDTMEQLLGSNLVLLSSSILVKYPTKFAGARFVGAHQDLKYWGISPLIAATAWIAIDEAGPYNGSMMFVPGSHKYGLVDHQKASDDNNILQDNQ